MVRVEGGYGWLCGGQGIRMPGSPQDSPSEALSPSAGPRGTARPPSAATSDWLRIYTDRPSRPQPAQVRVPASLPGPEGRRPKDSGLRSRPESCARCRGVPPAGRDHPHEPAAGRASGEPRDPSPASGRRACRLPASPVRTTPHPTARHPNGLPGTAHGKGPRTSAAGIAGGTRSGGLPRAAFGPLSDRSRPATWRGRCPRRPPTRRRCPARGRSRARSARPRECGPQRR